MSTLPESVYCKTVAEQYSNNINISNEVQIMHGLPLKFD